MSDRFDRGPSDRPPQGSGGQGGEPRRPLGAEGPQQGDARRVRERLSGSYEDEGPPLRRGSGSYGGSGGSDDLQRKLIYGAGALAAVLIVGVGAWSLIGPRQHGIPVFGPPAGPERDKPADPGGMQIMSGDDGQTDTTGQGEAHLAPGPEQPRLDALAKQYGTDQGKPQAPATQPAPAASPSPPSPGSASGDASPATTPAEKPVGKPAAGAPAASDSKATPSPATAPPGAASSAGTPAKPAPDAAEQGPGKAAPASPATTGGHMVQLAALDSEAEAKRQWENVRRQAPDLFSGREPVIEAAAREGRTFYRLRLGGFDSVQAARAFCIKAHAQSVACTPAQF